jgi:exodeoxyribonuclease-1
MQTFLFYDLETTGLNKAFDQILHFAAIRTDRELRELERYELKIRLNPDTVPSPTAFLIHGMDFKEIAAGISEYDGIRQIHQWFNQPETISLGYNTLRFDDEFLRFSFYRHLLPPYTHQYASQCGRMDLYPMTLMYYLFKNDALAWPKVAGKISFKLEHLNTANQLAPGAAHHAMVDVEATLALAQRFYKESEIWNYLAGYFKKEIDQQRSQGLENTMALIVHNSLGAEHTHQALVLLLGPHRYYKNKTVWLRLDTDLITQTTIAGVPNLYAIHKKSGEPCFILPFKERFLHHLTPERITLAEHNKKWLEQHPDLFKEITRYHTEYQYPVYPDTDAEAALYLNGFWSPAEETFCRTFQQATPEEKARMVDSLKDSRLKTLALRLLNRHFPEVLTPRQKKEFTDYINQLNQGMIIDYKGKKHLTPHAACEEIRRLQETGTLTQQQEQLLQALQDHLLQR